MATAAEFDDMNATPLGKLPMPAVQSKNDAPRMDAASYTDILKEMTSAQREPPPTAPAPSQAHQQQQQPPPQPHHAAPIDMAAILPPPPPTPPSPASQPQGEAYQPQQQYRVVYPARRLIGKKRRGGMHRLFDRVREYRTSALVTAVVFLMLWYVAPKLAHAVPQLLTPSGRFNMAGLAILAVMAGGIHRVADSVVPA